MTDTVAIALPNAVDLHVASEEGLVLVSAETGTVLSDDSVLTVKVNVDKNRPTSLVEGTHYRVGGRLLSGGDFSVPDAVFKGYGMGPEDHAAIFIGKAAIPA